MLIKLLFTGSGTLDFNSFCKLAGRFLVEEEDDEAMMKELKEAFRLYDREGKIKKNKYISIFFYDNNILSIHQIVGIYIKTVHKKTI